MFSVKLPVVLLSLLSTYLLPAAVARSSEADSLGRRADVLYDPPEAWTLEVDGPCGIGQRTTQVNASAKISFVGNRIKVYGVQNRASGIMRMVMDDLLPRDRNLWFENNYCGFIVDIRTRNGTHTLMLTHVGPDPAVAETTLPGNAAGLTAPVLYLTDVVYYTPVAAVETNPLHQGLVDQTDD